MFSFEHAHNLGTAVLVFIGLLGGYVLLLRIREYYRESPDPKITYASRTEHEKLRQHLTETLRESRAEVERLRGDIRLDNDRINRFITSHRGELSAALAGQALLNQRLTEVSTKLDRLTERS